MTTPQSGQTHSNNCLCVFHPFVGLALKGLRIIMEIAKFDLNRKGNFCYYLKQLSQPPFTWSKSAKFDLNRKGKFCCYLKQVCQPAFTCSKLTMKTPEKIVKSVQRCQDDVNDIVLVYLLITLNRFHLRF